VGRIQVQGFPDLHPIRKIRLLQLHPGAYPQGLTIALRVQPKDTHRSPVRFAQPFQAFDGGGFTGPVRTDHSEDLTFIDFKRDLVHGNGLMVSFP
jgi:hypothetical protein